MAILGLLTAESFADQRYTNTRREVFRNYPAGAAPLTGLLSLLKEEETDDPKFSWWEKRFQEEWATTVAVGTNITLFKTVTGLDSTTYSAGTGTWTAANANLALTAGTTYGLALEGNGALKFREGHVFNITLTLAAGGTTEVTGIVVANGVNANDDYIAFTPIVTSGTIDYDAGDQGGRVFIIGSAYGEGTADSSRGRKRVPTEIYNYTQISKTPFTISGTLLNTSVKYDETGPYEEIAKDHSVDHMIELEKTFLFGVRAIDTSGDEPIRYTGGILYFLSLWEAGATYGNSAATTDAADNKRIIENTTNNGVMTERLMDKYIERLFRTTNNTTNEKLCLCGSGFLSVLNQLVKNSTTMTSSVPMTDAYGMDVVKHVSPFGTIYYKTHPLLNQHPVMRYNALYVDIHNLVYRNVIGRDTELLTNRQANDADNRKDEWLTECGLEVRYPETHMYMKNVVDFA